MKINRLCRFSRWKEKSQKLKKKIVFTSCSFACFSFASSVESLFAFVFFIFESVEWSSAVRSSKRNEIVQKKEIKFLDEKIVIKNNVSNLCETSNSNSSSLNKSCVEIVEIEKEEEKKKKKRFCFEFFVIDFVLNDFASIESQICEALFQSFRRIENIKKIKLKEKKKKECFSKSSINIQKIDQSRTKTMLIWLKKFLRRENCFSRRRTREKRLLSQRSSSRSNLRWQSHRFKFCKCCFVD
jgi:hypothetical protein